MKWQPQKPNTKPIFIPPKNTNIKPNFNKAVLKITDKIPRKYQECPPRFVYPTHHVSAEHTPSSAPAEPFVGRVARRPRDGVSPVYRRSALPVTACDDPSPRHRGVTDRRRRPVNQGGQTRAHRSRQLESRSPSNYRPPPPPPPPLPPSPWPPGTALREIWISERFACLATGWSNSMRKVHVRLGLNRHVKESTKSGARGGKSRRWVA